MTRQPSVLLVEDSPDDAYFFQRALRRAFTPCSVKHLVNGREAVELLTASAAEGDLPDLVFLDLKMPVMSGFEVLEWLQQQTFATALRVIVLSGSNQQDDRLRAEALGASDYMVKPISSEALAERLRAVQTEERVPL